MFSNIDLSIDEMLVIPKELFQDEGVNHHDLVTYIVLKDFALDGKNNPSMAEITELTRLSPLSTRKAIAHLEELNWIKVTQETPTQCRVYELYEKPGCIKESR